jgi:hypothetical protein
MTARAWTTTAIAALALLCFGAPRALAFGTDMPLLAALRDLVAGNISAYDHKDIDATMRTIDTRSPDYAPTKDALATQFKDLDVKGELVSFDYMGHDDEFAVARVKTKTTGKPGSGFTDNTVDAIMLFHQQNGEWKLWSEQILGVQVAQ